MIIDFHTHIFPKEMRNKREAYFQNEPAFQLLYDHPKARIVGATDLIRSMDDAGIDKSVCFGFPWQSSRLFQAHNDYIIESVAKYPERLIGFCCVDPSHGAAYPEAVRCLESGMSGIGELAFYTGGMDKRNRETLVPLMKICRDQDKPILIHTNEPIGHAYPGKSPNTLVQIYQMVKQFPENKIVLAHWGGGLFFYHLLKKEVSTIFQNVFFDTAASPFLYDKKIYRIAADLGCRDKILFGSDYPFIPPARYFEEMSTAGLSGMERNRIYGLNAAKVLSLR